MSPELGRVKYWEMDTEYPCSRDVRPNPLSGSQGSQLGNGGPPWVSECSSVGG